MELTERLPLKPIQWLWSFDLFQCLAQPFLKVDFIPRQHQFITYFRLGALHEMY